MNILRSAALFGALLMALPTACMAQANESLPADLHAPFDALLQRYVVEGRFVDYSTWQAQESDRRALAHYIRTLSEVDPSVLSAPQRFAYWVNLYNAVTVDLILDHYPLQSIKDLGGLLSSPWKRELVTVGGEPLSLDEIEHLELRGSTDDPRLHFALNCASIGCPPLYERAFRAEVLEAQLEEVTLRTVSDPAWVDLSECPGAYGNGLIRLSKIFDWYRSDFDGEEGIRSFLTHYLPEHAFALANVDCDLHFLRYDWSLNEPPPESKR
jgi:hypothetical protein